MFATGEGILTQKDGVTADGLQEVFTTNLFGHFLLVSDSSKVIKTKACVALFSLAGRRVSTPFALHWMERVDI